jgi:phosphatidylglycerophosphate synthase
LWSIPGALSLIRAPLAVAFPIFVERPAAALAILGASGVSDVLDGWYARRFGQTTSTGAILDPILDKTFVVVVVSSLVVTGRLSLPFALLIAVRDIMQIPLVVWMLIDPPALADQQGRVRANVFGKIVTVLQFASVAAALYGSQHLTLLVACAAAAGVVAGASYWARALGHARRRRGNAERNRQTSAGSARS